MIEAMFLILTLLSLLHFATKIKILVEIKEIKKVLESERQRFIPTTKT